MIFCLNCNADSLAYLYNNSDSTNSFGEIGLINLPSAFISTEGQVKFTLNNNDIYKIGTLSVTPFSWMEASYFYYRPVDIWWVGPGTEGDYLDKGFNVKFSNKISDTTSIAIGLNDFAGTGLMSREYAVLSSRIRNIKLTMGLGWGTFSGTDKISIIGDAFGPRTYREDFGSGGKLSFKSWFRGDVARILGLEYFFRGRFKDISFKMEYDPFDYYLGFSTPRSFAGQNFDLRKKDSNINFGFDYRLGKNISLGAHYLKGNTMNFTLTFGGNFSKPFFRKNLKSDKVIDISKGKNSEESFYEDLIYNINKQNIFLQSAEISDENLKVAVASSKFRNPMHIHALLGDTVVKVQEINSVDIDHLTTIGVNVGHELHRISTSIDQLSSRKQSQIELAVNESVITEGNGIAYKSFRFRPTINYPAVFTGIAPSLVNHIGDPRKFYYGGIVLRLDNEIQFSSRLQLNSEIHQNITNNFDEKRNFPDSQLPRVRTDIVSYLQESDTYISRMQLDYFFHPYKEVFAKLSAGILENMYSGAGVEFLYKPFEQNFSIGLEAYRAKKRTFDRKFDVLDYEINTGHINFNYHLPQWGILGTLSYGKYLAGDQGYTFDISRRLSSGFRAGIFFTRTNVSAEQFGEGSFDKGFYFQIPIDLFLNDYRGGYINFKLRPLTRDGGQKLEAGNDLIGIMHSSSRAEIERDWVSFND